MTTLTDDLLTTLKRENFAADTWANCFYNALQHIKNLRDEITSFDSVLENLRDCEKIAQEEWAKANACAVIAAHEAKQAGEAVAPIYQYQRADGSWVDHTKAGHDYSEQYVVAKTRIVYAHPPKAENVEDDEGFDGRGLSDCVREKVQAMWNAQQAENAQAYNDKMAEGLPPGRVMNMAYSFCPSDLPHLKKMEWMADYFLRNFKPKAEAQVELPEAVGEVVKGVGPRMYKIEDRSKWGMQFYTADQMREVVAKYAEEVERLTQRLDYAMTKGPKLEQVVMRGKDYDIQLDVISYAMGTVFVGDIVAKYAEDAARYRWLRDSLYSGNVDVGEAYLTMRVVGSCPTENQFDAAIDAARGKA